jgi:ADP-ribosylglycohydrolase
VAAGILGAGDKTRAVQLAQADAEVTHSLDGVWCARATAGLITRLLAGADARDAIAAARDELPDGRWSARVVDRGLELAAESTSALDLALALDLLLVDKIYSYPVAAPETLALLLAHLSRAASADELMLGAFAQARNADALPALAGAVAGAHFGGEWLPRSVSDDPVVLDGVSIPWFENVEVEPTIELLERTVTAW